MCRSPSHPCAPSLHPAQQQEVLSGPLLSLAPLDTKSLCRPVRTLTPHLPVRPREGIFLSEDTRVESCRRCSLTRCCRVTVPLKDAGGGLGAGREEALGVAFPKEPPASGEDFVGSWGGMEVDQAPVEPPSHGAESGSPAWGAKSGEQHPVPGPYQHPREPG